MVMTILMALLIRVLAEYGEEDEVSRLYQSVRSTQTRSQADHRTDTSCGLMNVQLHPIPAAIELGTIAVVSPTQVN